jgi:hypothetical protein
MSKHTATPWHLYKSPNDHKSYVLTEPHVTNTLFKGRLICDGFSASAESDADMQFIVKAVNAHDELLASLKECHRALAEMIERVDVLVAETHEPAGIVTEQLHAAAIAVERRTRAVIAKTKADCETQ